MSSQQWASGAMSHLELQGGLASGEGRHCLKGAAEEGAALTAETAVLWGIKPMNC